MEVPTGTWRRPRIVAITNRGRKRTRDARARRESRCRLFPGGRNAYDIGVFRTQRTGGSSPDEDHPGQPPRLLRGGEHGDREPRTVARPLRAPLYVYHEIVHNKYVVERFKRRGVVFVESLDEVPEGAPLLYSAHGVSPQIREQARGRSLRAIDATCPLVTKVHLEAVKYAKEGYTIVLIGHEGHDEVIGTMGEAPDRMILVETAEDVERLEIPTPTRSPI